MKELKTKHGIITFPAFMPVTTFGDRYPADKLVRPYLKRTSQCIMVSYHYAKMMKTRPNMPIFIDSGGFAGLFEGAGIIEQDDHASIRTREGEELNPLDILHFQIRNADIGATLDFIIPPGLDQKECIKRQDLTKKNALYAQEHNITGELVLFASLQCWDQQSARDCAKAYARAGFAGIAIGGMVPRARDKDYIIDIVRAVREEAPECIIHLFGCGNINLLPELIKAGADSFDSSSYIRSAIGIRGGTGSYGVHSSLYAAVKTLSEINTILSGGKHAGAPMPNARFFPL